MSSNKGQVEGSVGELTFAKQLYAHFLLENLGGDEAVDGELGDLRARRRHEVVSQNLIPAQIRQLIIDISNIKG